MCNNKFFFDLIIKKDHGNLIDTSIVVPVRGVALIALLGQCGKCYYDRDVAY
jgi:hypothetical protein